MDVENALRAQFRFWRKVQRTDSCWIWLAAKSEGGYGRFWDGERLVNAHRFSYWLVTGEIPAELDHLCRNHACVRPDHLEAVTHRENVLRGTSPNALNAR